MVVCALMAAGSPVELEESNPAVVALNCLPFDNPERDWDLSSHCGYNHRVMLEVCRLASAQRAFAELYRSIERLRLDGHRDIYVLLMCKSGKHRSVCMACCVQLCAGWDDYYHVQACHLMTDLVADCRCKVCPVCDFRTLLTPARWEAAIPMRAAWPMRLTRGVRT
jgi:hypothetical protein